MHPSLVLLHLAGAVVLLLWAVRMVRTGVERSSGPALRQTLRRAGEGRVRAVFIGLFLAVGLQSSTAVALLATGFVASGVLGGATGLALLLGADVGSALVVKILSFDLSWLIPVLLVVGGLMYLKFEGRQARQVGRILLGIAFILLSLEMIGTATEPLRTGTPVSAIEYLSNDPVAAFLLAAVLTWAVHSSVATILLMAGFAAKGLLSPDIAVPLVLGANFGAGLIAFWLTRGYAPAAMRLPVGNLIVRAGAALVALAVIAATGYVPPMPGADAGEQLINLHVAFNVALAIIGLPLIGLLDRIATLLVPDPKPETAAAAASRPASALDPAVIGNPGLALASATRELLRMGERVELMLSPVVDLIDHGNVERAAEIRGLDHEVNRAHTDIKLYIARINRGELSEAEARRSIELVDFAINLEHAGDIIAKSIIPLVSEIAEHRLRFSPQGWSEIGALHARVLANLQLALNVLVSGEIDSARQLVREKEQMRQLERASHDRHLRRLQAGLEESIETSDAHLELVRAFKEINSLLATVAYPILSEHGLLSESRLRQPA